VARGKISTEIARKLRLSKRTIDFHTDNARIKLRAATRTEAVMKAVACGLINPQSAINDFKSIAPAPMSIRESLSRTQVFGSACDSRFRSQ
jgi:hypothetical protein